VTTDVVATRASAAAEDVGGMELLGVVVVAAIAAFGGAATAARLGAPQLKALGMPAAYVLAGWGTVRLCRRAGLPPSAFVAPPRPTRTWTLVLFAIPLLALGVLLARAEVAVLARVAPGLARALLAAASHSNVAEFVANAAVASSIGPIVEELAVRGFLLHVWARRHGLRAAVLWTSVVFAVLHANPLDAFLFAITMAGLYVVSGSLLVPMAAHALYNLALTVSALLAKRGSTPSAAALANVHWVTMAIELVGVLAVLAALLWRVTRGRWVLPEMHGGPTPEIGAGPPA